MVASANISNKRSTSGRLKVVLLPFLLTTNLAIRNSAILGHTEKWFVPSCSSCDSASGDVSIIYIFQNGG